MMTWLLAANPRPHRLLRFLVLMGATALPAGAQIPGTVTAQLVSLSPRFQTYAEVQPISILPLRAAEPGVLSGLSVTPGVQVHAGQRLATLGGPGIRNQILQDEAELRAARTQLDAARKTLMIQHQQMQAHLSTRQQLHQAASAVAEAESSVQNIQLRLRAVRQLASITAPVDAVVLSLNGSNGELVSAGDVVVTLQPMHTLWLRAACYGKAAYQIHTGMKGVFHPSDGSAAVAVRVQSVAGAMTPDGAESILMTRDHGSAQWMNGEFGTVSLRLPAVKAVKVPTAAMILSQGKWWVLIHSVHGDQPQQVTPMLTRGWNTYISAGLTPGVQVVVSNAYLRFHSSIAESYQIPD